MKENVKALFTPIRIGGIELKNRIVMPPMDTCAFNFDGTVTSKLMPYMRNRAKGGVGLIIQECADTSWPEGKNGPRELRMDVPDSITFLHDMTNVVHSFGTKIILQLNHAGFQSNPVNCEGRQSVCPSDFMGARAMTHEEVLKVIQDFIVCAYNAKLAGYDGVELHAAHGYLLNCFLNPAINKREDEFGGVIENRFRMVGEIIKGIREKCGYPFIISVRLGSVDNPGNTLEESSEIAYLCEKAGADIVNMSSGFNPPMDTNPTQWAEEGLYIPFSEAVKKKVSIPVAIVGKLKTPEFCADVIKNGSADLVCIGRQLLCDPEWPNKIMQGRINEIRPCLSCFDGCMGALLTRNEITRCSINPYVGFEDFQSENNVPKTAEPKTVLVVGGGISGMQFAIISARRGNKVILAEKEDHLGGQMMLAGMTPHKEAVLKALKWFEEECVRRGVEIRLNQNVDMDYVNSVRPDQVVLAAGAVFAMPPIEGIENAVNGADVIARKIETKPGQNVVVIGGGVAGAELAHRIVLEGGKAAVLEMLPEICRGGEMFHTMLLKDYLNKNATVLTSVAVRKINPDSVEYEDTDHVRHTIPADLTAVCAGQRKMGLDLYDQLLEAGYEAYRIGNNERAANFLNATRSAFELAYTI